MASVGLDNDQIDRGQGKSERKRLRKEVRKKSVEGVLMFDRAEWIILTVDRELAFFTVYYKQWNKDATRHRAK